MMPITEPTKPNTVYKYYDRAGRLIYIGSTVRGGRRQDEHAASSPWFRQHAVTQDLEQCRDREEMLRVERELIKVYRPPFNKVHNENWESVRAAYLAVVAAEDAFIQAQAGFAFQPEPDPCRAFDALDACLGSTDCEVGEMLRMRPKCERVDCAGCHRMAHGCRDAFTAGCEVGASELPDALHHAIHVEGGLLAQAAHAVLKAGNAFSDVDEDLHPGWGGKRDLFCKVSHQYAAGQSASGGA